MDLYTSTRKPRFFCVAILGTQGCTRGPGMSHGSFEPLGLPAQSNFDFLSSLPTFAATPCGIIKCGHLFLFGGGHKSTSYCVLPLTLCQPHRHHHRCCSMRSWQCLHGTCPVSPSLNACTLLGSIICPVSLWILRLCWLLQLPSPKCLPSTIKHLSRNWLFTFLTSMGRAKATCHPWTIQ